MTDHYKEVGLDDFLDSILDREERELFRREFGLIDDNEFHSGEDEPGTNETLSHSSGLSANSGEQTALNRTVPGNHRGSHIYNLPEDENDVSVLVEEENAAAAARLRRQRASYTRSGNC